jgi:hypothetical protein
MTIGDAGREAFEQAMAREPGLIEPETTTEQAAPLEAQAEPTAAAEGEAPATGDEGRERDPATGKFVAKKDGTEQPKDAGRQSADDTTRGIPSGRLREEAEARRQADARAEAAEKRLADMERQLSELRQAPAQRRAPETPQAPPNIFENPDAYIDHRLTPIQQAQEQLLDRTSRMVAVQAFGKEVVDAAFQELAKEVQSNPAARYEAQRIWQAEHPYGALVEWHKSRVALKEIGTDPAAYQQKLREQLLNDPEFVKQAIEKTQTQARTPVNGSRSPTTEIDLPPSLATRAGASGSSPRAPAGDAAADFRSMFSR